MKNENLYGTDVIEYVLQKGRELGLVKERKSKKQKAADLDRLHKSFHYVKGKIR